RRFLFQVQLWLGIATGIYVVVISVSGSAVVFRRDLNLWLVPRHVAVVPGARLSKTALSTAAEADYPGFRVTRIGEPRRLDRPVSIDLARGGEKRERLFDPYTGRDLGDSFPPVLGVVEWIVRLHDDLLTGPTGRSVNGIASLFVTALALTGAVIWWPGRRRWRWSLAFKRGSNAPRFTWQLHTVLGFWSFALIAIWAVTGIYFAFPGPFEGLMNYFDTDLNDAYRPGERFLLWLIKLHFGRFGGPGVQVLWTLLGLLPAVLFVTGFTLWWRRVVRRRMGARRQTAASDVLEAISDVD
ncbi:MAG TPA: PepSY-associated TM helix domain-containing protein, partial [Gammaproteobacteria bacterium]|nr:PepSY-associated TM helix domain-containing protein [Gammaproteobacteria bacterium]